MDINVIANLTNLVKSSGLSALEVEENGMRIRLENSGASLSALSAAAPTIPVAAPVAVAAPAAVPAPEVAADAGGCSDDASYCYVKSTVVGVFVSLAKAGRQDPKPGDTISKGDVVCVVEAMKTMFDVPSEVEGEFVELLCADGDTVEVGQPLAKLKK